MRDKGHKSSEVTSQRIKTGFDFANNFELPPRAAYALAFLLPCAVMLCVFAAAGISPFGDKTLLATDMDVQYSSFFSYLHRALLGKESLLYSFQKGAGGNAWGLFSYYISSPFFLLAAFFPNSAMPEGIALITLLKIGTAGLTFSIFLNGVFKKRNAATVLFSVIYALSSYMVRYSVCIMWLDACIWLPIILLGAERISEKKSPLLFISAYAILMISNYYTCFMASIFTAIFFIYRYFTRGGELSARDFLKKAGVMLGSAMLGVMLGAFILIPSFLDLSAGKLNAASYVAKGFWNIDIFKIPRRLFPGQVDSMTNSGNPLIFCGMLCGLLTGAYFFNPSVRLRDKLAALGVYAILIVSFFIKRVDMVWHIFNYPNWFPYRYAFAFCFFSVFISFLGFSRLKDAKLPSYFWGAGIYLLILICVRIFLPDVLTDKKCALIGLISAAVYAAALLVPKIIKSRLARQTVLLALIPLCCVELGINAFSELGYIDKQFHYKSRSDYEKTVERDMAAVEIMTAEDGFYRSEKTFKRTDNDSMSYGYNGLSHYSSNFNKAVNDFTKNMGMFQSWLNCYYNGSTILTDSILGVKRVASLRTVNDSYKRVGGDGFSVYENPYSLSIGFMTSSLALKPGSYSGSWLSNQDVFAERVLGARFYRGVDNFAVSDGGKTCRFTSSGYPVYLSLPDAYSGDISVTVNDRARGYIYDGEKKKIFYIGDFNDGDEVKITLNKDGVLDKCDVREFDIHAFENTINRIKNGHEMEITDFSDTRIEGRINVSDDNTLLFTTIPYERGWSAYADGKKVDIVKAQDTFSAIRLSAGEHTVKFVFRCPGLRLGLCISLLTLAAILACALKIPQKIKDNKNKSKRGNGDEQK